MNSVGQEYTPREGEFGLEARECVSRPSDARLFPPGDGLSPVVPETALSSYSRDKRFCWLMLAFNKSDFRFR
jgi:hypothetical protein